MRYLVNFSTGLASFEAARRTIEQKGREDTTVIFCDVRGDAARISRREQRTIPTHTTQRTNNLSCSLKYLFGDAG